MTVSELMQAMADAGAPMEAIIIAVRALEQKDAALAARDAEQAEKRAKDAERKREERAARRASKDSPRTLPGQGADASLDKKSPQTPKKIKPSTPPIVPPKAGSAPAKPDDVSDQVWGDWLGLRKAKRAPVSPSVIDGARQEAGKLNWPLEKFLAEWVLRGSQGLKAEWITSGGRPAPANDSFLSSMRGQAP